MSCGRSFVRYASSKSLPVSAAQHNVGRTWAGHTIIRYAILALRLYRGCSNLNQTLIFKTSPSILILTHSLLIRSHSPTHHPTILNFCIETFYPLFTPTPRCSRGFQTKYNVALFYSLGSLPLIGVIGMQAGIKSVLR